VDRLNWYKLNPVYWIRRINEKMVGIENMGHEGIIELACDLQNNQSKLHCPNCSGIMPVFRMILKSKSVNMGEQYQIRCPHCKKMVSVTKGEIE